MFFLLKQRKWPRHSRKTQRTVRCRVSGNLRKRGGGVFRSTGGVGGFVFNSSSSWHRVCVEASSVVLRFAGRCARFARKLTPAHAGSPKSLLWFARAHHDTRTFRTQNPKSHRTVKAAPGSVSRHFVSVTKYAIMPSILVIIRMSCLLWWTSSRRGLACRTTACE